MTPAELKEFRETEAARIKAFQTNRKSKQTKSQGNVEID